eukprot:1951625-Rhodomonas_salina.3
MHRIHGDCCVRCTPLHRINCEGCSQEGELPRMDRAKGSSATARCAEPSPLRTDSIVLYVGTVHRTSRTETGYYLPA